MLEQSPDAEFVFEGREQVLAQAAEEFQLRRAAPVDEAADPLKDLEASLMNEGAFGSWGSAPAEYADE